MRAERKAKRTNLKTKLDMYRRALRGAKYVIDAQEAELQKRDPANLIIQPSQADIVRAARQTKHFTELP